MEILSVFDLTQFENIFAYQYENILRWGHHFGETWPEFSPSFNEASRDSRVSAEIRIPAACTTGGHSTKELPYDSLMLPIRNPLQYRNLSRQSYCGSVKNVSWLITVKVWSRVLWATPRENGLHRRAGAVRCRYIYDLWRKYQNIHELFS